jgi:lysozyme family protein
VSTFENAKAALLKAEGGYSNDPNDPGGETNFGVSKRSYPQLDIKNLTFEEACINVYTPDYWNRYGISAINPQTIATKLFLALINMNPMDAIKCLQRALNTVSLNESFLVDGRLGSNTIKGINACQQAWLLDRFRIELAAYYLLVVKANEKELKFLEGWIGRALT